jgi:hypothetical protein
MWRELSGRSRHASRAGRHRRQSRMQWRKARQRAFRTCIRGRPRRPSSRPGALTGAGGPPDRAGAEIGRAPRGGSSRSRPVSRIQSGAVIHLAGAGALGGAAERPCGLPGPHRAGSSVLLGLAPGGVCPDAPRRRDAGALLPHHFTFACARLTCCRAIGRVVSVALSRGFPRVGVTHRPCPMVSGLSSRDHPRDCVACKPKCRTLTRPDPASAAFCRPWPTKGCTSAPPGGSAGAA